MATSGRKRVPTEVKKLRGTLQPCRVVENEANPDLFDSIPTPPDLLNEDGKEIWFTVCGEALKIGILYKVGFSQIEQYAVHYQIWKYNARKISKSKTPGVKKYSTGSYGLDYNYKAMNEAQKWMERFESNWGLNPSSASKISVPEKPPSQKKSKFDI